MRRNGDKKRAAPPVFEPTRATLPTPAVAVTNRSGRGVSAASLLDENRQEDAQADPTDLGLAICRELVERSGGALTIEDCVPGVPDLGIVCGVIFPAA